MSSSRPDGTERFDPASLAGLDEPVRRYFSHALRPGALLNPLVRLTMIGRIKVAMWLPFAAEWEGDGRSFLWRAQAGPRRLRLLRVVDHVADGVGGVDVRLLGRVPIVHADDEDTARSAAGRAAVEAVWTPAALLPELGVTWRAETDTHIVACWDVPPERPEVHLHIDEHGGSPQRQRDAVGQRSARPSRLHPLRGRRPRRAAVRRPRDPEPPDGQLVVRHTAPRAVLRGGDPDGGASGGSAGWGTEPEPHIRKAHAVVVKTTAQVAMADVADVDRDREFPCQPLGALVGLGPFSLPAGMILRPDRPGCAILMHDPPRRGVWRGVADSSGAAASSQTRQ